MIMQYKRIIILTLSLLTALYACQKAPVGQKDEHGNVIDESLPMAVSFGTNVTAVTQTKGIGALDAWNAAQRLHIYGFERVGGALDFDHVFIKNIPADSPASGTDGRIHVWNPEGEREDDPTHHEPFYYGASNIYDFFGYFVDDACGDNPEPTIAGGNVSIGFTIDGTQDIMIAATDKTLDVAAATAINGGVEVPENRLYSAYSARRQVYPKLRFHHMLSRFRFVVQSGNKESDTADPVTLTSLQVETRTTGTMTITTADGTGQAISNFGNSAYLPLRLGEDLHPLSQEDNISLSKDDQTPKTLNGSLLAIPGQEIYKIRLTFIQQGFSGEFMLEPEIDFSKLQNRDESMGNISTAQGGEQYLVTLVVYGMEKVLVNVSLEEWQDGGTFHYDPDQD